MKSFEAELGAADAKVAEQKFIEQTGDGEKPEEVVLNALDNPELSLEASQDERDRINRVRMQTAGTLDESWISEETLRSRGIEKGVNPSALGDKDAVTAEEHFGVQELDPLVESDTLAEARLKDPAKAERYAAMKRELVSRQADIGRLRDQIEAQKDETIRGAQMKVLAQFQRELETLEKEMDQVKQSF